VILLVAVATLAVLVAPRRAAIFPLGGLGVGAVVLFMIVLSNVPGLDDGIGPNGWLPATLVGMSTIYATVAVIVGVRGTFPS